MLGLKLNHVSKRGPRGKLKYSVVFQDWNCLHSVAIEISCRCLPDSMDKKIKFIHYELITICHRKTEPNKLCTYLWDVL